MTTAMLAMNYSLGIDFGTSGIRAIAINPQNEIVAIARSGYNIRDCETWKLGLYEVIASLPQEVRQNIRKIVIDGTSATVLICDRTGQVLAPPMLYNEACDAAILEQVKKIAPPQHSVCSASSSFTKLIALAQQASIGFYFLHQALFVAWQTRNQRLSQRAQVRI